MRQLKILLFFFLSLAFLFASKEAYAQAYCGDFTCDADESLATCPQDCTPVCAAPTIVSHSDTNQSGGGIVNFSWSSVPTATQYQIQRQNIDGSWPITPRGTTAGTSWGPDADGITDPNWRVWVSLENGSICTAPGYRRTFDPGAPAPTNTPAPTPIPVSSGAEVYHYSGSGTTWDKISDPVPGVIISGGTNSIPTAQSMASFNGNLIMGTFNPDKAELYSYNGTSWTKISQPTPGQIAAGGTTGIDGDPMIVYNTKLYSGTITIASTRQAEVYRYDGGTSWAKISAATPGTIMAGGTSDIDSIYSMAVYNGKLYVGTRRARIVGGVQQFGEGAEIYAYDDIASSWTKVSDATPGVITSSDPVRSFTQVDSMAVFNGLLYVAAAQANALTIYSYDGTTWTRVSQSTNGQIAAGGTTGISDAFSMGVYNNNLYVGSNGSAGATWNHTAEVYRYDGGTSWTKVSQPTAGTIASGGTSGIDLIPSLVVYNTNLYAATEKIFGEAEVYRYNGGTSWTKVSQPTPGTIAAGGTSAIDGAWSMAVHNSSLYMGTEVINPSFSGLIPTPTPPSCSATGQTNLQGTIYVDSTNTCVATTPYTFNTAVTVYSGGLPTTGGFSDNSGFYSVNDTSACGTKTATISNLLPGYILRKVKYQGGACIDPTSVNSYTFDFSGDRTLDWFLSSSNSWFQIGDGDTRNGSLTGLIDNVPSGLSASTSPLSAFFSSNFNANFGAGSTPGFVINNEYSYNSDPKTKQGLFSYTFFMNRSKIKAVTVNDLATAAGVTCVGNACSISNLPTGAYRMNSDLTITSYSHLAGSHVLLLVNGTATIQSNIKVPSGVGNLFVLAAKGDVNVDPVVGTSPPAAPCGTSACTNIEGIYTAERSIILQSVGYTCADGVTADRQFTLAGNFVTNALKSFRVGGSGVFGNKRSLCANDATYPVFVIQSRYDFVPQLTDFYKSPAIRWKEVNP